MRIICDTEEELKQAKNMTKEFICDKISDNECIRYGNCDICFENNCIYIQMYDEY